MAGNCPVTRPPYESGHIWTFGRAPAPGFEFREAILYRSGHTLRRYVKPAERDEITYEYCGIKHAANTGI